PSLFLRDVIVDFFVVTARVFFLAFTKRNVIGDAADASVLLWIFLRDFEWNADRPQGNTSRPVKLDVPGLNILLRFLHRLHRIPTSLLSDAGNGNNHRSEKEEGFHQARINEIVLSNRIAEEKAIPWAIDRARRG